MAIQDMYRVRTVLSGWQGAPGLSTCYFDTAGVATSTDALTAVNRVRSAWDAIKGVLSSSTTAQVSGQVDTIASTDETLTGGFTVTTPAIVTGTGVGNTGPAQVSAGLVLLTSTIIRGRRLRGRINVSPLVSAQTGTVLPSAALNAALVSFGTALLTASPPATPPLVVWSRPVRDPVTHAITTLGSQFVANGSTPAAKFFSLRSRRD